MKPFPDSVRCVIALASFLTCSSALALPPGADAADPQAAMNRNGRTLADIVQARAKALGDVSRDLVYTPLTPCRLIDTRGYGAPIQGGPFVPNTRRSYMPQGLCGLPTANVASIVISFTTENLTPNSGGYLAILAPSAAVTASVDIFNLGSEWSASNTAVTTGPAAQFDVFVASANAQLVVDVLGYFAPPLPGDAWHIVGGTGEPALHAGWSSDNHAIVGGICGVWSPGCPVWAPVSFRKGSDGRVHLRGAAKYDFTSGGDTIVFKLPPAYVPVNDVTFRVPSSLGTDASITIYGGGFVQFSVSGGFPPGPHWMTFDGIAFALD